MTNTGKGALIGGGGGGALGAGLGALIGGGIGAAYATLVGVLSVSQGPCGVIGVICAAVSLAVFGAENLVIPAMVLVLIALLGGRRHLCT